MKLAVSFTNLGPYHLARLRALAVALGRRGDGLIAYETAAEERLYPWRRRRESEPFRWVTLFPDRALEDLVPNDCALRIEEALERDQPDAVAVAGYARPETMAAAHWARRHGRPRVLMSESQWVDRPRTWWKEALKRRRIAAFSSALVGGEGHRDYLVRLGMDRSRIALGYNAVDNLVYSARAQAALRDRPAALPSRPYFLSVCRFAPEKNLPLLVRAYAAYRERAGASAWDLVLCGGGPHERAVAEAINACRVQGQVHRPGFLQADGLAPWYAFASAFVLASLSEPWGLVVNEAAASGLPLLVSDRAGAAGTLVPEPAGTTGRRFDPASESDLAQSFAWMAGLAAADRKAMGDRARAVVADWGPERFARGMLQALGHASPGIGPALSLAS